MGAPGDEGTREELLSRACLATGCGLPGDGHHNSGSVRGWCLAVWADFAWRRLGLRQAITLQIVILCVWRLSSDAILGSGDVLS